MPEFNGLLEEYPADSPFTDIDDSSVTWAYELNIVSGVGNDRFNPNGLITRQEAAKMLTNLAENVFGMNIQSHASGFNDQEQISPWANDSVSFVSERGIMSGVGNNIFAPQSQYTREQSMVTVMRLFDAILSEKDL